MQSRAGHCGVADDGSTAEKVVGSKARSTDVAQLKYEEALFCNSGTTEAGCTHVGARGSGEGGSAGTHPPLGLHDELGAWIRIRRRSA